MASEWEKKCREMVVWGFFKDFEPEFVQGSEGEHELCEPITADMCTAMHNIILVMSQSLTDITKTTNIDKARMIAVGALRVFEHTKGQINDKE